VNGVSANPVFTLLKRELGGGDIKWNFEKFLVDKNGIPVKRYSSSTDISAIEADIMSLLSQS
jgi:glutathione peroxidase